MKQDFFQWLHDFNNDVPHRAPKNEYPIELVPAEAKLNIKTEAPRKVKYPTLEDIMGILRNTLKKYETK